MFHLHSLPSVFVCVPYWYSNLFHFPLEKLASFDGPGEKTTKRQALTFLLFQSPYLFRSPPTLCFCLLVLSSSYSISLSKFLSYSFFSCWFLLSFLMGIKKSSSYASVYSDQVEYTHRHTQLKHLPSITQPICLDVPMCSSMCFICSKRHLVPRVRTVINLWDEREGQSLRGVN